VHIRLAHTGKTPWRALLFHEVIQSISLKNIEKIDVPSVIQIGNLPTLSVVAGGTLRLSRWSCDGGTVNRFSIFILLTGLLPAADLLAAPASVGVLTLAETPVQLIRATTLYQAPVGTRLQSADLIESSQSNVQIDKLAGIRLALGPHTRIYLERSGGNINIGLLNGWLKLQPVPGTKPENLTVSTATLMLDVSRSAGVIHADGTRVEVFVEDGLQTVIERDSRGREGRKTTLRQEEYAQRKDDEPLSAAGRPGSDFISAMPPAFFDPLPTIAARKLPAAPLEKVRDVDFDDVSPLLIGPLKLNVRMQATRFSPRLADPTFRQAIVQRFGGTLEWETELYRFERKATSR